MPNANAAGAALLGLISANRPPAMINFTSGAANILAACAAAKVDKIVTSRSFIEKAKLQPLVERLGESIGFIYLEDVAGAISGFDKLRAFFHAREAICPAKPDDCAAILFTSGSEGVPKGVALSHRNILSNVAQAASRIDFGRQDKVFNVLPIFHSFGLTGGFLLPLVSGVPIYLYPSPLHYRIVPELIYGSNATILFGTDTLLTGYARSAHPYDLRSLRYIIAGAEAVKEATRRLYAEKFGLRILEGYGVTETAPVLALNTPMFNRFGTVGRIMPGIETRLETVAGIDEGARLHVRGPNIMLGYFRAENPGVLEQPPGRLARHRRHRRHRRAGFCRDQGTRQALRQDRRRDDLAGGGGKSRRRLLAGRPRGGGGPARSAQGRAHDPLHRGSFGDARATSWLSPRRRARLN